MKPFLFLKEKLQDTLLLRIFLIAMFLIVAYSEGYAQRKYKVSYTIYSSDNVYYQYPNLNLYVNDNQNGGSILPQSPDDNGIAGTITGSYEASNKPDLSIQGSASTDLCFQQYDEQLVSYDGGCTYYKSASACGISFTLSFTIQPIASITGSPAPDPNTNYCPGSIISLLGTSGFNSYTWQYKAGTGSWITIRNTTSSSTTVSDADIGGNYMANIYFRVLPEGCSPLSGNETGSYIFSPGAVSVNASTPSKPSCHNGADGKIEVTSLSRALKAGEVAQITLYNASSIPIGNTVQASALPIVLDGADHTRFPNGIAPGSYTMLVETFFSGTQPSNCGDAVYAPVTVENRDVVAGSASVSSPISCTGLVDGAITLTATGGDGNFEYSKNGTTYQASNVFTGLGVGSYTFIVRDGNQCVGSASNDLVDPLPVSVIDAYVTTNYDGQGSGVSCHPNSTSGTKNDGTIKIEASGGTGTFQYSLIGVTYSKAYQTGSAITNLYPDSYTVSVKDQNGCISTDHPVVPLTPPAEIVYTGVSKTDLTCNGTLSGSLQVQGATGGTGALQYSLDGSTYQSSNQFTNLSASTFSVTVKDTKGCTKVTTPVILAQPSAISLSGVSSTAQSCAAIVDGSISLPPASGGTGVKQYSINDTDYITESTTIQFTGLASGSYTVYAKDTQGCKGTTTQFVTLKPVITGPITVSQSISCYGKQDGALNLTPGGGTSPYTFKWSTNETTEDIAGLADNLYSVEIKDSKGCSKSFNYDLQEPAILILQPAVQNHSGFGVSCFGSSDGAIDLTVQGGTAPFAYAWSTTSTQEDIANLAPGQYDIHVTDAHGCQASSLNITVSQPTAVALSLDRFKNISCKAGSDGELEGLASGGVGYYEYSLNGTTWQNEALFTGLKAQPYTLYLRDGNGCASSTVDHTLTEPPLLVLALTKKIDTSCGTANGSAEVEASGGAGNYQYNWHDATNVEIGAASTIADLSNGDYQAIAQDGNGCVTNIAVIINDSDGPKISQQLLKGLTCFQSNDGEIGIAVSEGLPPYTIKWDTQESATNISNVTGGEHWVEVLDMKGCKAKETFIVDFPVQLGVTYTINQPLCTGNHDGSVDVTATGGNAGGYRYTWATGETQPQLLNIGAGTYMLIVKDSKQCTTVKNIIVTDPPVFAVDAGGNRTICVGQKLTLSAQEDNATYSWTSDKGFESISREVTLQEPAVYTLHVTSSKGCRAEDSFVLQTSTDLLKSDFLMSAEAHAGDTVVMVDISWPMPDKISWVFPAEGKIISSEEAYAEVLFNEAGEFAITLTAHLGECVDSYVKTITILEGKPNAGGRQASDLMTRFEIYPNPNDGEFAVLLEFSEPVDGRMRMFPLSGNSILLNRSLEDNHSFRFQESLQNVSSGIYLIIVEANGRTFSKRVIIK